MNTHYSLRRKLTLFLLSWIVFCCVFTTSDALGQEKQYIRQEATVIVIVCSRGCYQYLLKIKQNNNTLLVYPDSISTQFQENNLEAIISGTLTNENKQIYKPSPTDVPVPHIIVPILKVDSISLHFR